MIVSKAALQAATLCAADKDVPALSMIQIEPDGTVVAANGKAIIAVSPIMAKIREAVPLPDKDRMDEGVVLGLDTVRDLVKQIGKDTQFKGLLDHVSLRLVEPGKPGIVATTTDGKRRTETTIRRIRETGIDWLPKLREAFGEPMALGGGGKWVVNRLRLRSVVDTLDRVCPYSGDFSPVFWTFFQSGTAIVRTENELTGQRAVVILSGIAGEQIEDGDWLDLNDWEKRLASGKTGAVRRKME